MYKDTHIFVSKEDTMSPFLETKILCKKIHKKILTMAAKACPVPIVAKTHKTPHKNAKPLPSQ